MQATGNKPYTAYSLSIRLSTDGFSFFVNHATDMVFVQQEHYTLPAHRTVASLLEEALENSSMLKHTFKQIRILVNCPTAHIPLDNFNSDQAETLYRLSLAPGRPQEDTLFYNVLPGPEVVEVGAIPRAVDTVLQAHLPQRRLYSVSSTLLPILQTHNKKENSKNLYVYLHDNGMDLVHYEANKLAFANTYAVKNTDNALYFILNTWKALGLDALNDRCVLVSHPENGATTRALRRYIKHVVCPNDRDFFPALPQSPARGIPFDYFALLAYPE